MEKSVITLKIDELEMNASRYEKILRTTFIGEIWKKHIQCQIVNHETILIRNKINELLKVHWNTSENYMKKNIFYS